MQNKSYLENIIPLIGSFLQNELKLTLHSDKIFIKTLYSGMDYLGWINFFDYRILRTKTKNRMFRIIKDNPKIETLNSYFGLLKHGNTHKIKAKISSWRTGLHRFLIF